MLRSIARRFSAVRQVGILGAGETGSEVGLLFASHPQFRVRIFDLTEQKLATSLNLIQALLRQEVGVGLISNEQYFDVHSRLAYTVYEQDLLKSDIIIDTISSFGFSQEILARISPKLENKKAVFCTTNVSESLESYAKSVKKPKATFGLHFMNRSFAEIAKPFSASEENLESLNRALALVGTQTLVSRGFISPELIAKLANSCAALCEEKGLSIEEVNLLTRHLCSKNRGVFELADSTGLAKIVEILNASETKVSSLLGNLVAEGNTGVKAGKGFFEYPSKARENEEKSSKQKDGHK